MNRSVDEAALDVAIERLTTFHAGNQIFIFGAAGKPFWARFAPLQTEIEVLKLATSALEERSGKGAAPLTFQSATGAYTAFILDAEETLFAVVLMKSRPRSPAEDRQHRRAGDGTASPVRPARSSRPRAAPVHE